MLASQRESPGIDLADLLASAGISRGERPRQRARPTTDMQDPTRVSSTEHDPHPPQVIELEVRWIGEIDVRDIHAVLEQQPARRTQGVTLDNEIATPSDDL
jgi:hypothetical protein